ncbi:MAG: hypothetical protein R3343_00095 [Nitriliruptorales bacterium]|nr:hypothetical protein [Nitriliruptorales bacterium]
MPRTTTDEVSLLIAGVGIPWAGDLDLGPLVARRCRERVLPAGVHVEEVTVAAHRVVHLLQELAPDALLIVACHPRGDEPGTIRWRAPQRDGPDPAELQARLGESVSGVIDLDHILAITAYYGALPEDTCVLEVEPIDTGFAAEPSADALALVPDLLARIDAEVARLTAPSPPHRS